MKCNRHFFVLLFLGLLLSGGCSDEPEQNHNDMPGPDTSGVTDTGDTDTGAGDVTTDDADADELDGTGDLDTDAGAEDTGDGQDADVASNVDTSQSDADVDTGPDEEYDWPCPAGTREDASGDCVPVPTLRIQATDSLSVADGESFDDPALADQITRNLFVSASSSPNAGSLPRENLGEVDRCRAYGALISIDEVESFDAGPVTILGMRLEPAEYTPSESSSVYTSPPGIPLGDAYATGATLNISGAGTEDGMEPVFPSFEHELQTLSTTDFEHTPIAVDEPVTLSWEPHPDADVVRIDIETRQGGIERIVVCEVVDDGQYEVSAEMTSHLLENPESTTVSLYQSRSHRIEPEESNVLILLSATNWMRRQ